MISSGVRAWNRSIIVAIFFVFSVSVDVSLSHFFWVVEVLIGGKARNGTKVTVHPISQEVDFVRDNKAK